MKRFSSILLVFCAALLVFPIAACEKKETADVEDVPPGTIAMVGPETITVDEMSDAFRKQADFLGVENITPEMKQDLLTRRIERMLAWLYARDQGMQVPPEKFEERTADMSKAEIQERLDGINEQLLIEQVWQGVLNGVAVTQEEIEEYYQGNKDDFRVPDLYRVYLVKVTEERADHVLQMSRKDPSSFDDMALKTLTDEVLKRINQNAVLSPKDVFPDSMVPHLERMKVGDIEGPVETPRGIFLFKLVDREPARLMSLQEATPAIERILLKQKKEATLKGWFMQQREKYPVKVYVADLDRIGREQ